MMYIQCWKWSHSDVIRRADEAELTLSDLIVKARTGLMDSTSA